NRKGGTESRYAGEWEDRKQMQGSQADGGPEQVAEERLRERLRIAPGELDSRPRERERGTDQGREQRQKDGPGGREVDLLPRPVAHLRESGDAPERVEGQVTGTETESSNGQHLPNLVDQHADVH